MSKPEITFYQGWEGGRVLIDGSPILLDQIPSLIKELRKRSHIHAVECSFAYQDMDGRFVVIYVTGKMIYLRIFGRHDKLEFVGNNLVKPYFEAWKELKRRQERRNRCYCSA